MAIKLFMKAFAITIPTIGLAATASSFAATAYGDAVAIAVVDGEMAKTRSPQQGEKKVTERSHPDYMRCRQESVIGSRARKRKVCMTNKQWEEYARTGNSEARAMVEDISKGGIRSQ